MSINFKIKDYKPNAEYKFVLYTRDVRPLNTSHIRYKHCYYLFDASIIVFLFYQVIFIMCIPNIDNNMFLQSTCLNSIYIMDVRLAGTYTYNIIFEDLKRFKLFFID